MLSANDLEVKNISLYIVKIGCVVVCVCVCVWFGVVWCGVVLCGVCGVCVCVV